MFFGGVVVCGLVPRLGGGGLGIEVSFIVYRGGISRGDEGARGVGWDWGMFVGLRTTCVRTYDGVCKVFRCLPASLPGAVTYCRARYVVWLGSHEVCFLRS